VFDAAELSAELRSSVGRVEQGPPQVIDTDAGKNVQWARLCAMSRSMI
jgi:hypothetical protein